MRIVSVLPSATEIVFVLGHGAELVGRSAECDYPPEVASLPVVMRPRTLDLDRSSAEIDRRVQDVRGRDESLYDLDIDRLSELAPDLILTQDLCRVCSVTDAEVASACARADVAPRIVSLTPRTLAGVFASIEAVGRALEDPAPARALTRRLRERCARPPGPAVARVAVVEWLDPPIVAGLWTPDIVRAAGGESIGPRSGRPGERTGWARLSSDPPDLLVLSPCSFSVDRSRRELEAPALRRAVAGVRAPLGTFIADEAYFSRPGPRLADGVELVRHLLARAPWDPPMPVAPYAAGPEAAA
ncbi:MAG TPA: cobalamin-binding protein [Thermoplasmata archaeon]|nr:cobalamin-binding protein [Thermoplasmata archaeon]